MEKLNLENALQFYKEQRKKLIAIRYVGFVASWDMETEAASGSIPSHAEQLGVIAEAQYNLCTNAKFEHAVEVLYQNRDKLDEVLSHEVEVAHKDIIQTKKIPQEQFVAYSQLTAEAQSIYVDAKVNSDFKKFQPTLTKIIDYQRNLTKWLEMEDLHGYNILLDMYEPNFKQSTYDEFFGMLKTELVPFVKQVASKKLTYNDKFTKRFFSVSKQAEFCEYIRDVMCFDKNRGIMKQSEHPFTSGFGTNDVRITNHYYTDNLKSSIFSVIHETGHALYEQQCDESLNQTLSGGGASMGMHESQSRFYENIIGRSYEFWEVHFGKLKEIFAEELCDVTLQDWYKHINEVENSFIRVEADELTYPLHIMLRYEMEKEFITGNLNVEDFPKYWNEKFTEYFGITPTNDKDGVLQDIHWAGGSVGYFPTYALGGAIASQLYFAMNKDFDVQKSLVGGTTEQINKWLATHVHKYGASKYPTEIIELATGEQFNAKYYVEYLIDKYSKLYGLV